MLIPIAAILFGFWTGKMSEKTHNFCECFRNDFKGAVCEPLKTNKPNTCEAKK